MKKIISLIIICSSLLIGCKSDSVEINYEGKSQRWDVSYKIEGTEKLHESYYTFRFIGTANMPEDEIKFMIDGPKEGEEGKFSLHNKDEYTGKMGITGGIPDANDRDIRVKIEWNGETETAILKRSK